MQSQSQSTLSEYGENLNIQGFTQQNLDRHFGYGGSSDHSSQYPDFTQAQYAQRALTLAQSPVGEGIEGYLATKGKFSGSLVRYDTSTNDWVRAWPIGVATMFKPDAKMLYFEQLNEIETI